MTWHTLESVLSLILTLLTAAMAFHALARSYLAIRRLETAQPRPVRLAPAPPYPNRPPAGATMKEAA